MWKHSLKYKIRTATPVDILAWTLIGLITFIIVLPIGRIVWNNLDTIVEVMESTTGETVGYGVVKITIDEHEYFKTSEGALTHSESCPCKQL